MNIIADAINSEPLISRAVGPMVGAAISGTVALFIWWRNRARPSHIEARLVHLSELLHVSPALKKRLAVTFDGAPINDLTAVVLSIFNSASETVKPIEVKISFPNATKILTCELSDSSASKSFTDDRTVKIRVPYLNSYKPHKHTLTVKITCDGKSQGFTVDGHGEGWSARYLSSKAIVRHRFYLLGMLLGAMLIATYMLGTINGVHYDTATMSVACLFMILFGSAFIGATSWTYNGNHLDAPLYDPKSASLFFDPSSKEVQNNNESEKVSAS